jgi:two-component system, cell cycle sensor histidine kinase and response regulator CckA
LCVNARDAMPDGGKLTLLISREEVGHEFVEAYPWAKRGSYVVIDVRDTGIGMDSQTTQHIFEPFFTTKGVGKGTGLGLATVYGIVKQHAGIITVTSVPGSGTDFRVFFPVAEDVEDSITTKEHEGEGVIPGTVLLVEDDPAVRAITRFMLKKIGMDVIEAEAGDKGLSLLERHSDSIILAIIDLVMPNAGGSQIAEKIHDEFPDLPILFISGYAFHPDDPNSMIVEGQNFLKKPFNQTDLKEKIRLLTS